MRLAPLAAAAALTGLLAAPPALAKDPPLPPIAPAEAGFSEAGLGRIDSFFAREIAAERIPGAVIGIVRDGRLVALRAYGQQDKDRGIPMQVDSIFGLASMTKILAAVGALTLTEQGKLPLYSPVASYYPGFGTMQVATRAADGSMALEPQRRPITIQDLMRHTSGLTYGGRADSAAPGAELYPPGSALYDMRTTGEFIAAITKLPLVYQPGTVWNYGVSTDVLGAVVEKVAGKPLGAHLTETVFQPLGMVDTGFRIDPAKRDRIARALPRDPLTGRPQSVRTTDADIGFDCAGACATGTVPDYLRFGQMLLNGGSLEGRQVLSPATVKLMTSNHLGPAIRNRVAEVEPHRDGYGFGLTVAVRMEPGLAAVPGNVGEYSWNGAFGTGFFADPAARLVVVFATAAPGDIRKYYREQVQDLVYGAMTR